MLRSMVGGPSTRLVHFTNRAAESYLRGRSGSKFNRHDFDCLSNKFVSRLVIRAN